MKKLGAHYTGNGRCEFTVWAPEKKSMVLHLLGSEPRQLKMEADGFGYYCTEVKNVEPGLQYYFQPEGRKDVPDPASHYQPEGVHGPSSVVDHASFIWSDHAWRGIPFGDLILYELHVGTFTTPGTFEAVITHLDDLKAIGINAIELMPVAQFPGSRNWGYDAVYPYAVQNSYGGPEGLKKLVDTCHQKGMAVFLDVVYNHLGPEGNYFSEFAPYFTRKYSTPWGDAINFDGDWSDGVREYFSENPLHWFEHYHIDGLRIDAIHMVYDSGAIHFWELTHEKIRKLEQRLGRSLYTIAESDLNSPKVTKGSDNGGYCFSAQWLDDFHHSLYVLLDTRGKDRYVDFGTIEQLAKAYKEGFVHSGEYVKFRKRRHGASSAGVEGDKFVIFNLNHDQVGNRVKGERLCMLVDHERLKLAAAAIFLSPYIPMLFMGEEYADRSPFYYFVSHSDEALIKAVQEGRKKEFEEYKWDAEPPDPQSEKTFFDSKLNWSARNTGEHRIMLEWHQKLVAVRNEYKALKNFSKNDVHTYVIGTCGLVIHRQEPGGFQHMLCIFNFSEGPVEYVVPYIAQRWNKILDSREKRWVADEHYASWLMPSLLRSADTVQLPSLSVSVYLSAD
jgi:maltooligosyltrehalose trehalohydrolase